MNYALKSALDLFQIQQNELVIGKRRVTDLVQKYGTPLFVYDKSALEQRFLLLNNALPPDIKIHYAVKANPNPAIITEIARYYKSFDVASAGEFKKVIKAGISPDKINFAGPGKSIEELSCVISQDIGSISIESKRELEHCIRLSASLKKKQSLLVRVNPSFELSSSGIKMGGGSKPFGIDSELVPSIVDLISCSENVRFTGLHIFAGSHNLSAENIIQTFEKIIQYAIEIQNATRVRIKKLNLGGGFGVPLYAHEHKLDIMTIGKAIPELITTYGPQLMGTQFNIELGRFIVAGCGVYLSKILYIKKSRGQKYYIIDGGMHHHLSASGNFGQSLVRRPMPIIIANKIKGSLAKVHVVGPLCTPLDTFGYVDLPEADEDDLVAVLNSGAYGASASPVHFLSHPLPKEVLV